ncbi:MAG: hypothetical protein J5804_02040 [Eggerthellaceae bacterium]|nr:hypothetical protein [Eggerthellaceae bacterium]
MFNRNVFYSKIEHQIPRKQRVSNYILRINAYRGGREYNERGPVKRIRRRLSYWRIWEKGTYMKTTAIEIRKLQTFAMVALFAGVVAVMLGLSLGVSQAWAGAQPGFPTLDDLCKKTYTLSFKGKDPMRFSYSSTKSPSTKITNAKSSNTEVATVEVNHYSDNNVYIMNVTTKKAGTTKISFKLGKKNYTVKYVVKPYKNYLTSFKVGSKNFKSQFDPSAVDSASYNVSASFKGKTISGKVNVKLKSGWKIKKIWYWTQSGSNWKMHYIKNGGTAKKAKTLYVWAQNGSHCQTFQLYSKS